MFASSWLRQLQRRWFPRRTMRRVPVRRGRVGLEVLEERLTPSTWYVWNGSDTAGSSNDVTLRYAINQSVSNHDQNQAGRRHRLIQRRRCRRRPPTCSESLDPFGGAL
jgi:hypothetical protein